MNKLYAFEKKLKIDLSLSENPLGCSPRASRALQRTISSISKYPDPRSDSLRKVLARKLKVNEKNIAFGNGSENLIDLVCRSFLKKGDEAVIPDVTFWLFETSVELNNGSPIFAKMTKNFEIDLDKMAEKVNKKTKIIFICNPNNPTGKLLSPKNILDFVKKVSPVIVVVDEAIIEFAGKSVAQKIKRNDNLIVLRTFSKAFGLAGLRLGVILGPKKTIKTVEKFIQPFPINKFAQEAVIEVIKDKSFLKKTKQFVDSQRNMLTNELRRRGFIVFDSQTNNILVKIPTGRKEGAFFFKSLIENNVSVAAGFSFRLDERFFRISVRDENTNRKFIKAVDKILAGEIGRMV